MLTEQGLYKILFTGRSKLCEKFRNFVFDLLHNLRIDQYTLMHNKNNLIKEENNQLKNELNDYKQKIRDNTIYQLQSRVNNKKYLGITHLPIQKRRQQHFKNAYNIIKNHNT